MGRMGRNFRDLLEARWAEGKFVCIGLDSEYEKIPEPARPRDGGVREAIVAFNRAIIDATADIACAYKPNPAFYEVYGDEGWEALRETIQYAQEAAPGVAVILDAKRGDIGNTNVQYARSAFEHLRADAVTVQPYLGGEPLAPFFEYEEKGVIVLCHTSNPGADEIQALPVGAASKGGVEPLYKRVTRLAATKWNARGNCCVFLGATYPEELKEARAIAGAMPILTAGIGAQDGDLAKVLEAGLTPDKKGLVINASRSIIFASRGADFAEAARAKASALDAAIRQAL